MKHKFTPKQEQEQRATHTQHAAHAAVKEFANSDELLRYDAAQTPVPPEIAARLQKMSAHLAPPARPWWKAWLGRA